MGDTDHYKQATATLSDGTIIETGALVKIDGLKGIFTFHYLWLPDGSLTCHGPNNSWHARTRSFRPEHIRLLKTKARK